MEKPAVVFSAEGFKMFTDLIRDLSMSHDASTIVESGVVNMGDADELVKEYFARDVRPDLSGKVEEVLADTKYDMDDVARVVAGLIKAKQPQHVPTTDIRDYLEGNGFHYSLRAITPVMSGVMNRHPEIQRVDAGMYAWEAEGNE